MRSKPAVKPITIGKRSVGPNYPPYIVAELSGNHNGLLENALKLVDAAKAAGVDAVKIQTYTPDTITLDSNDERFRINNPTSPWFGRSLYDLYKEASLPWEWHAPIFKKCRDVGITAFSSPFDETAVDFLEQFDVPCYKIASPEIVDLPLIKKVAATGKPLIISTGGATLAEIQEAVEAARSGGCKELVLLKCTASYPAEPKDANLNTIPYLTEKFGVLAGLSDHSLGIGVAIASVALGGCVIEKHFTLSRSDGGVDSSFSMEPAEMASLVQETRKAWEAIGEVVIGPMPSEATTLSCRPSLWVVEDVEAGEKLQGRHLKSLRPAGGLPPKEIDQVLGKTAKAFIPKGTPLSLDLLS